MSVPPDAKVGHDQKQIIINSETVHTEGDLSRSRSHKEISGMVDITTPSKTLKDTEMVFAILSPFNLLVRPCKN